MACPLLKCSFRPDPLSNMATIDNSCFWMADLNKSSPQKPLGQMNRNLVGSIYGMSSIKIVHFVPIRYQTWPQQAILVSDWLISKKSDWSISKNLLLGNRFAKWTKTWKSTNQKQELPVATMFDNESGQNEQSLQRTFHRCFLPRFGSFGKAVSEEKIFRNRPIRNKNYLWQPYLLMDWDEMSKLYRGPSTLKQLGQMDRNLVGSIYGRSSMGIAHFVWIR